MGTGTFSLPSGGGALNKYSQPDPYVRPADWLPISGLVSPGDQKIVILHKVVDHDSNYCAFTVTCTGGYTVDWGDGTAPENIASASPAYHKYTFSSISAGTTTSWGYRQAIITITPTVAGPLTVFNGNVKHNQTGLSQYSTGYLDFAIAGTSITSCLFGASTMNVVHANLEKYTFIGTCNLNTGAYMFNTCYQLQDVTIPSMAAATALNNMFNNCSSLQSSPFFTVNTAGPAVNMTSMFNNCNSLIYVPLYDTRTVTLFATMFNLCSSLQVCPFFDTRAGTSFTSMFATCRSLIKVPPFNMISATNMSLMFDTCTSLQSTPSFTTSNVLVINLSSVFIACQSLVSVGLFNTGGCTNFTSMFEGCGSLQSVPLFDMGNATNATTMFLNCVSLTTVPQFNTIKVTAFNSMFSGCSTLMSVPQLDMRAATATTSMFLNCSSLVSLADPLTVVQPTNLTAASSMFSGCKSLTYIPFFDTSKVTTFNAIFNGCSSVIKIPDLNTVAVTNWTNAFANCDALERVPMLNMVVAATVTTMFSGAASIGSIKMFNIGVNFGVGTLKLSKTNLEEIFENMCRSNTTATITITTNPGVDAAISRTNCGVTNGSNVITQANTAGFQVGMLVTGTGVTDGRAVTFTDVGDTVTSGNHGLTNGARVSFPTIATTTGITARTLYYVVNATTNTFQVSLTPGGSVLPLTNDGSGTVIYPTFITSINTNVSFTTDRLSAGTTTSTLSFRLLNTSIATMKGWTVTG